MSTGNLNRLLENTPWQDVPADEFLDWRWQVRHRITTFEELEKFMICARKIEKACCRRSDDNFATTPYYAALSRNDETCPIRKQIIPTEKTLITIGERGPLGEEELEAAPNLIHRYEDRLCSW